MDYFRYVRGELFAEDVPVEALIEEYGTPLYVYSHRTLARHLDAYAHAFAEVPHIVCFAAKANSNSAILRLVARHGGGADIVSGGELYRALRVGIPPEKIVYAGVGKTDDEIRYALGKRILMFNVESGQELERINAVAGRMGVKAPVALRINPDIDPETHPYISTGLRKHKFGIPIENALEYYRLAKRLENVEIIGVHKHIGSQITRVSPFVDALQRVLVLVESLRAEGIGLRYLDIGGGLGIQYNDERPPHPKELARRLLPLLRGREITLIMEPGRSIAGNAGILLTKVLYLKRGDDREFVIVDAGMNDLMRPTLYDAYHHIAPVRKNRRRKITADIVGPVCESGDFLARNREINRVEQGEYLAVMSAGAYGFSMSSNYNSRPRPAEVLVRGGEHYVIRKRETYRDLVRGEVIPDFLQ
ncbi:MAG TPA: diaminopimelate decarboxylase [Nitrospirae bacterium]|nr:diaminopimelate decarboxylase [Nitrospirota bacterium]